MAWGDFVDYDYSNSLTEVSWRAGDSDIVTEPWWVAGDGDVTYSLDPAPLLSELLVAHDFVARAPGFLGGAITASFDVRGLEETLRGIEDWRCGGI